MLNDRHYHFQCGFFFFFPFSHSCFKRYLLGITWWVITSKKFNIFQQIQKKQSRWAWGSTTTGDNVSSGCWSCNGNSNWWLTSQTSHRYTVFFFPLRSSNPEAKTASKYKTHTQTIFYTLRIKGPRRKLKQDHQDLHPNGVLRGVPMMLSLLEVVHQLPAPRGDYQKNCGRPAGPRRCWSAMCPSCAVSYSTLPCSPTAIIHCINEGVLLLDTESHRTTAHRNTWQKTIANGFTQKISNVLKMYYPV